MAVNGIQTNSTGAPNKLQADQQKLMADFQKVMSDMQSQQPGGPSSSGNQNPNTQMLMQLFMMFMQMMMQQQQGQNGQTPSIQPTPTA